MIGTIIGILVIIFIFKGITVLFDILDRAGEEIDLLEIIKNKRRKKEENKND